MNLVTRCADEPVDGSQMTSTWRGCQFDFYGLQLALDDDQQINLKAIVRAPKIQLWFTPQCHERLDGFRYHPAFQQRTTHGASQSRLGIWLAFTRAAS